jgi:hypothetical protein
MPSEALIAVGTAAGRLLGTLEQRWRFFQQFLEERLSFIHKMPYDLRGRSFLIANLVDTAIVE